ncbi:MAG TPA: DnaA/Hda family protein [Candidatus Mcinerneyibacteriales bacterium]|nr:DnaA/Hda family protein [Candidatus Mcinerneyibacteriales bacterium]
MQKLFEINGIGIHLTAQSSDSLGRTGFLTIEGSVSPNNIQSFEAALKKIKTFNISITVIDFSKVSSFCEEAWALIRQHKENLARPEEDILLLRMPPTLFEQFHARGHNDLLRHFRAFGDLDRFMVSRGRKGEEASYEEQTGLSREEEPAPDAKEQQETEAPTPFSHEETEEVISEEPYGEAEEELIDEPSSTVLQERFPLNESREVFEETEIPELSEEDIKEALPSRTFETETIPEKMIAIRGKLRSMFENKIYEWKSLGYDTSYLDGYLDKNLDEAKKAFALYSKNLADCREMEAAADMIENPALKKNLLLTKSLLKKPMEIDKAREAFSSLLKEAEQLDHDAFLPLADYQFDNFIKGNNKDAVEMVRHLVQHLDSYDRPLLIHGSNGTGKTHILNAIGNTIRLQTSRSVNYIPANSFIVELENMREQGRLHLFRKRYMSCEVLLFDDIHLLEDASPAAHEFRFLMDSLARQSKLLIMASVLKADDFRFVGKDLQSRLKSAIHLTMAPPDELTLTQILEKRMSELKIDSEKGVPRYLAQMAPGDIRKAFGLLETLHLYANTYHESISYELVRELTSSSPSYEEIRQMTPPSPPQETILPEHEGSFTKEEETNIEEEPFADGFDEEASCPSETQNGRESLAEGIERRPEDDLPEFLPEEDEGEEPVPAEDEEPSDLLPGEEHLSGTEPETIPDVEEEPVSGEEVQLSSEEEETPLANEETSFEDDESDPFAGLDDQEEEEQMSDVTDDSDLDLWDEVDENEDDPFAL